MEIPGIRKESIARAGILCGATDRHSHIIWGVDDGCPDSTESLSALAFMESAGISDVWATPHINEYMPNTTEGLRKAFEALRAAYTGPVRLHLAAEYMLDTLLLERMEKRDLLVMEGNILLVEASTWNPPVDLYGILKEIMSAGYRPLIAHPERYRYMEEDDYASLVGCGALLQLNLPSLTGFYGETAREKASALLRKGMYSCAGSDCHRSATVAEQYNVAVLKRGTVRLLGQLLKKNLT